MDSKWSTWTRQLQLATNYDGWGQPLEASQLYYKLSQHVTTFADANSVYLTDKQQEVCCRVSAGLRLRGDCLKDNSGDKVTLEQVNELGRVLKQLVNELERRQSVFLAEDSVPHTHVRALSLDTGEVESEAEEEEAKKECFSPEALRAVLGDVLQKGKSYLSIRVDKIGLKDSATLKSPFVVVTLRDAIGISLETEQKTPYACRRDSHWLHFNTTIHLQRPLQHMPKGFAIFFELRHYKVKKKYISTKCFSFLEEDEIKNGAAILQIYKKPTDYRRRNIHLLSSKRLYLHLHMHITQYE